MKRKFVIATAIIVGLLSSVSAKPIVVIVIQKSSISLDVKGYHAPRPRGG